MLPPLSTSLPASYWIEALNTTTIFSTAFPRRRFKESRPWLVLVINDNVIFYVTYVCFAEQMVS
jgi:hypothetical protein